MKRKSPEPDSFKFKKPKRIKKCLSEDQIKEIPSLFLSDKKNSNVLFDLLDQFNEPVAEASAECVKALQNIFVELLKRRDMAKTKGNLCDPEDQYKNWLCDCYEDAWKKLSSCLIKGTQDCKLQALNSMFELLSAEAKYPLKIEKKKKKKKRINFPVIRLKRIIKALSLAQVLDIQLIKRFSEFLQYKDVNTNIWLSLMIFFEDKQGKKKKHYIIRNVLCLLMGLPKPKHGSNVVLCDLKNAVPEDRVVKAAVEKVWKSMAPYKYTGTEKTVRMLLIFLLDHIKPRMENTIFLTDYFMDALNRDDSEISLLALRGIYELVSKHNIEYPNIYGKLYQLFTRRNIEGPHRIQLFVLADLFLRSTHLPMALVAAFARKFSRLCLLSIPQNCLVLMTLAINMMIRHPELDFLIHNPDSTGMYKDPFIMKEKDPLKSRATESQLYEFFAMQNHYRPEIRKVANLVKKKLPTVELPLQPALDFTWKEMLAKDRKKVLKIKKRLQDRTPADKAAAKKRIEQKLISKGKKEKNRKIVEDWARCPIFKLADEHIKANGLLKMRVLKYKLQQ